MARDEMEMGPLTLAKLTTEALKPASGVIDALLGPKINRIKNWAEKRDLQQRLDGNEVNDILNRYTRQLLLRICQIRTIMFPQQPLPLTSIYEPLTLISMFQEEEFQLNAETLKQSGVYTIVDSAGMGKSTFAKHLALEVMNSPQLIPIFFELRRVTDGVSLLEILSKEIDPSQKEIDARLLPILLEGGGFVIILDGFDEVPEQLRSEIAQQITDLAVRFENSSIVLTSRPELSLPDLPESEVFEIDPLSIEQAESLVRRYDAAASIDVGSKLIREFNAVPERFLETPLLVALLYKTYSFNHSIATKITSFYDEIYNAFYKGHDLTKAGFIREKTCQLDAEEFRRLLMSFSFLLIAHQEINLKSRTNGIEIVNQAISLTSVKPLSASHFFDDLLLAVPLLIQDGTDFRFIHKSITEFFAAEFLAYQADSESIIKDIRDGPLQSSFINTLEYLSEINPNLFRKLIVAPLAHQVLKEKNPIQDPLMRSIDFLGGIEVWVGTKGGKGPRSSASDRQKILFSAISGDKKYRLLVITRQIFPKVPTAAWRAIARQAEIDEDITYAHLGQIKADILGKCIPLNQWVPINEETIPDTTKHPEISRILLGFIHLLTQRREVRVLDENACRNVLSEIEEKDKASSWLKALVAKE